MLTVAEMEAGSLQPGALARGRRRRSTTACLAVGSVCALLSVSVIFATCAMRPTPATTHVGSFFEFDGADPFSAFGGGGGKSPFSAFGGGLPFFEEQMAAPKPKPRTGPIDNTSYYKLMGVKKEATQRELDRAYKRLAIKHHPDKGGDHKIIGDIKEAYDCLSDKGKRKAYDSGGKEGVEEYVQMKAQRDQLEKMQGKGKKMPTLTHKLKVTLEDVYNGKIKRIALRRTAICSECAGAGTLKEDADVTCQTCKGRGTVMRMRQLGRGMIQQIPGTCPTCQGSGSGIAEKDKCRHCMGKKTVQERKIIEIPVERGMDTGEKIIMKNMADEKPGHRPGDLHIILDVQKHDRFHRVADFLMYRKKLTAREALCGFGFELLHLNNKTIYISSDRPISPGSKKIIKGMGMKKLTPGFGDLIVHFDVEFPEYVTEETKQKLREVLPGPDPPEEPPEEVFTADLLPFEHWMIDENKKQRQRVLEEKEKARKKKQIYDAAGTTDEEEMARDRDPFGGAFGGGSPFGRQRNVQCQTQ
uniref:J domain-containing protein n=1 Tax=Lotharella globosa TaxID=91324 RepID=A0A7S4DX37_9EUKA